MGVCLEVEDETLVPKWIYTQNQTDRWKSIQGVIKSWFSNSCYLFEQNWHRQTDKQNSYYLITSSLNIAVYIAWFNALVVKHYYKMKQYWFMLVGLGDLQA